MSAAQIPWALVPGGTLPKAPAPRLACDYCPAVAVHHETWGEGTFRACEAHKGNLKGAYVPGDPEDARSDAEALAELKALDKGACGLHPDYAVPCAECEATDKALDAAALHVAQLLSERDSARMERDRALMRAQRAEDSARFWEAEAKGYMNGGGMAVEVTVIET